MPNTKIINVLKGDTFQDVFDAFSNTEAEEVIFIIPKGSKLAKNSKYFQEISDEAIAKDRSISVMSSDPKIAELASQYGINIMSKGGSNSQTISKKTQTKRVSKKRAQLISETTDENELADDEESVPIKKKKVRSFDADEVELVDNLVEQDTEDQEESADNISISQPTVTPSVELADFYQDQEPEATFVAQKSIQNIHEHKGKLSLRTERTRQNPEEIFINVERNTKGDIGDDLSRMWNHQAPAQVTQTDRVSIPKTKKRSFFLNWPFVVIMALGVAGLAVFYTLNGSVSVTVRPQKQDVQFELAFAASVDVGSISSDVNRLPGQNLSAIQEITGSYPVSGKREVAQKAKGTITIYNEGGSAQKLVATTRFQSKDGFIFRIPASITVPAGSPKQPGTIQSSVYADKAGENYNIGPTDFTVPGFEGTENFKNIYAKSTEPMKGGIIGNAPVVAQNDYDQGIAATKQDLKTKLLGSIKDQATDLVILESLPVDFQEPKVNAAIDEATENLEVSISGKIQTIAFREEDIRELSRKYIEKTRNLNLIDNSFKIKYENPKLSSDQKTLTFNAIIEGQAAAPLDIKQITTNISGLTSQSVRDYFQNDKQVESAHIFLSPFWLRSIPKNQERIDVKLEI